MGLIIEKGATGIVAPPPPEPPPPKSPPIPSSVLGSIDSIATQTDISATTLQAVYNFSISNGKTSDQALVDVRTYAGIANTVNQAEGKRNIADAETIYTPPPVVVAKRDAANAEIMAITPPADSSISSTKPILGDIAQVAKDTGISATTLQAEYDFSISTGKTSDQAMSDVNNYADLARTVDTAGAKNVADSETQAVSGNSISLGRTQSQGTEGEKVAADYGAMAIQGPPISRTPPPMTTAEKAAMTAALKKLKPYESSPGMYDIQKYLLDSKSPGKAMTILRDAGFDWATIQAAARGNLTDAQAINKVASQPLYSTIWQGMTPWDESAGEKATAAGIGIMAAEMVLPGVYTTRHWGEMSSAEKAFSISMDVVSLLPFVGAIGKGAKEVATVGRLERLAGGLKGAGKEIVNQARAPVDMIIHPIGTAKSAGRTTRDLLENLLHPGKLPESVITTADGTVRLRVTEATSVEEAKTIRDELMRLAQKGETPVVEIGGQRIELARSPLMKEAGGLVHTTPDIEVLEGARVQVKPELPENEQGWFVSHEPATTFTQGSAFGKGSIPIPSAASDKIVDIARYRPGELVYLDKRPIRGLNLSDVKSVPDSLAEPLTKYIKNNDMAIGGSLNEWLKVKGAAKPNDLDIIVRENQKGKAISDIVDMAKSQGFQARAVDKGVDIMRDGEWQRLVEFRKVSGVENLHPGLSLQAAHRVDGVRVMNLGEQYILQSYGAVAKDAKAAVRAAKLEKAANDIKRMIKDAGIKPKKPGIYIIAPKSAVKAVSSDKIYSGFAEMESKFQVGETIPGVNQRLFTRLGPTKVRVEVWLEKPLSPAQILKLKGIALVEDLKAPFNPAITIKGAGNVGALSENDLNQLTGALARAGNKGQARAVANLAAAQRSAPRTIEEIAFGRAAPRAGERAPVKPVSSATAQENRVQANEPGAQVKRAPTEDAQTERVQPKETITPESERTVTRDESPPRAEQTRVETPSRGERVPSREEPSPRVEREPIRGERVTAEADRAGRTNPPEERAPRQPVEATRGERPPRGEDRTPRPPEERPPRPPRERTPVPPEERPPRPPDDRPPRPPEPRPPRPPRPPGDRPPRPPEPRPPRPPRPPEPRPPRPPEPRPPRVKRPPSRLIPIPAGAGPTESRQFPKGTVAWKQGIGWWVFSPPYNRPEDRAFVLNKPQGAVIASDAKTAVGTIQSIGGPSPVDVKFDMGIEDVGIVRPPQKPNRPQGQKAIKFKRDTDKTYSGANASPAGSRKIGPYHYRGGAVSRKPMS